MTRQRPREPIPGVRGHLSAESRSAPEVPQTGARRSDGHLPRVLLERGTSEQLPGLGHRLGNGHSPTLARRFAGFSAALVGSASAAAVSSGSSLTGASMPGLARQGMWPGRRAFG